MTAPSRHVVPPDAGSPVDAWRYTHACDCGELSCGELILELRQFVAYAPPGARILVTARDPAAFVDVPAWCVVTGHPLVAQAHPYYLIDKAQA